MRLDKSCLVVCAIVVSSTLPGISWAKSSLDARVERIENILENQINAELLQQVDQLQQEVQELRGKLEEQQHATQLLAQKQEKLFLNLDSRIGSLMKNSGIVANSILPPESVADPIPDSVQTEAVNLDDEAAPSGKVHASDSMWRVTEYKEKETYENSYKYVTERKYPAALQAFKEYLAQYPNGTYAANAHYWIGEVYAAQWQANRNNQELINNALASFKTVVKDFPKHQKAQDALLKLGIVEADLQHVDAARGYLSKVIQQYPNTSSARIAQNKLNQLAQIGH